MKKIFLAIIAMLMITNISAQGLGDILKSAASSAVSNAVSNATSKVTNNSTLGSTVSNLLSGVLGTSTVSESSIVGTWSYSQPAVVFESNNVLTNLGTSAVSTKVQTTLQKGLNKIGFTAGKVSMTFKSDKTGTITVSGKSFSFKWSVSGSNLTVTLGSTLVQTASKSFTMNVKQTSGNLQLAMKSDKLLSFLTSICNGTSSSGLSTITSLVKNINGLYLGLQFSKK